MQACFALLNINPLGSEQLQIIFTKSLTGDKTMNFKDHMEHLKTFFTPSVKNVILLIRWLITAIFTGLLVGAVGTLFYYAMSFVTGCRTAEQMGDQRRYKD